MKKGITAVSAAMMVVIIVLLAGTVTITTYSSVQNAKKLVFAIEISEIQEEVTKYYDSSVDAMYPTTEDAYTINLSQVTEDVLNTQFNSETKTSENNLTLYEVDLSLLGITDTTYGNLKNSKDVYVLSKETGIVYYLEGVKAGSKTYYTITRDLIDIKERNEKEEDDETSSILPIIASDGIVERTLTNGTKEKYIANIEVLGDEVEVVKYEIGIIKEENAESYFKNSGSTLNSDRIKLKEEVPITIYAENSNGDFVIKYAGYPYIPEEFVASDKLTEDEVNEGLVIYEGKGKVSEDLDAETTRNQFVWIPVPDMRDFKPINWTNSSNFATNYIEPIREGINFVDDISKYSAEISQYNSMKASVEKYGGFYIARYEAGQENSKPVSKKEANVWNNIAWDPLFDFKGYGLEANGGPAKVSKSVIASNSNVISHLIYGVQWDAVMTFMKNIENENVTGKKYIENSTGMGWYSGNYQNGNIEHKTGIDVDSNASNKVKNIYDMAGNVWEWTYEASIGYSDYGIRVLRGCSYAGDSAYESPSLRSGGEPDFYLDHIGFRFALYIK